ncbi:hypothetical protein HK405_011714, partial [Cladochytrium tenue]
FTSVMASLNEMDPVGTPHSTTPPPPPPPASQLPPTGSRMLGGIWESAKARLANSTRVASEFLRRRFVVDFNMARAGAGRPVTSKARLYADEHIRLVDTVGFIRGVDEGAQRFDGDLLLSLVDSTRRHGKKAFDIDGNDVDDLQFDMGLLDIKIPVLIIIAKADSKKAEDVAHIRAQVVHSLNEHTEGKPFEVAEMRNPQTGPSVCEGCDGPTLTKPRVEGRPGYAWYCSNDECDYSSMHLAIADTRSLRKSLADLFNTVEVLLERTMHEFTVIKFRRAQLIDTDSKVLLAAIPISVATVGSLAIGWSPIPFSDAPLLITTQSIMVASICGIFGVSLSHDNLFGFLSVAASCASIPLLGLAFVNLLRLVPGVGTVAAAAIEAPVAASLTLTLGIVVLVICRQLLMARLEALTAAGVNSGGDGDAAADSRPQFLFSDKQVREAFGQVWALVRNKAANLFKRSSGGSRTEKKNLKSGIKELVVDVAGVVKTSPLPVGATESATSASVDIEALVAAAEAAGAATNDEVAAPTALPATAAVTGSAEAPGGDVEERTIEQIFFADCENEWEDMD